MWTTAPPSIVSGKTAWKKWRDRTISTLWVCAAYTTVRCREPKQWTNIKPCWNVYFRISVVCWRSMWTGRLPLSRKPSFPTRKCSTFTMPDYRYLTMPPSSGVTTIMATSATSLRRKSRRVKVEMVSIITSPIGDGRMIIFGWEPSAPTCFISRWNLPTTVASGRCGYWT